MTDEIDPVDAFLDAYFGYLDGKGVEPTLDHLNEEERTEVEQLIASLGAGRGIDPEASRPSISALLARAREIRHSAPEDVAERELMFGLKGIGDSGAKVTRDVASVHAGLDSRLVVQARGMRIRVLIEPEGSDIDAAYPGRINAIAALFGAFPDTRAVLLSTWGRASEGTVVDRDDIVTAIETPSGSAAPPRLGRPITDPVTSCVQYIAEVMPVFEPFAFITRNEGIDFLGAVNVGRIAAASVADVVDAGQRARLEAKRTAWSQLAVPETAAVEAILSQVLQGSLDEVEYRRWLETTVEQGAA